MTAEIMDGRAIARDLEDDVAREIKLNADESVSAILVLRPLPEWIHEPAVSLAYARQAVVISVDEWASRLGRLSELTRQADVLVVAAAAAGRR